MVLPSQSWNAVKSLPVAYIDQSSLHVKTHTELTDDGAHIVTVPLLRNLKAVKKGGTSTLFLTDNLNLDEVVKINELPVSFNTLTTQLKFNSKSTVLPELVVEIDGNRRGLTEDGCPTDDTTFYHYTLVRPTRVTSIKNTFFEIVFVDDTSCNIKHTIQRDPESLNPEEEPTIEVFLTLAEDGRFYFTGSKTNDNLIDAQTFFYTYDAATGALLLSRLIDNVQHYLTEDNGVINLLPYSLTDIPQRFFIQTNTFRTNVLSKLNTSWVSYTADGLNVNAATSAFNIPTQYLLEYKSKTQSVNILALKNILCSSHNLVRGTSLSVNQNTSTPAAFNFRRYNNIFTEQDSEQNAQSVKLNYVSFDTGYTIEEGDNTINTPESIYPYETLNINDTNFTANGAYSSYTPKYADRITVDYGKSINGSTYLTTWLSAGSNQSSVWVDRYYYPDYIERDAAYSQTAQLSVTLDNTIDQLIRQNVANTNLLSGAIFFDKLSDLTIKPNSTFTYHRVNIDKKHDILNNAVQVGFANEYNKRDELIGTCNYEVLSTGKFYTQTNFPTSAFTLNTQIQIPVGTKFYKLLGTGGSGINIVQNTSITPFIAVPNKNTVTVYNNNLERVTSFDTQHDVRDIIWTGEDVMTMFVTEQKTDAVYKITSEHGRMIVRKQHIPQIKNYVNYFVKENSVVFLTTCDASIKNSCVEISNNLQPIALHTVAKMDEDMLSVKSIVVTDTEVLGFYGEKALVSGNDIFVLIDNKSIVRYNIFTKQRTTIFKSSAQTNETDINNSIIDFAFDSELNMAIAYNNNKIAVVNSAGSIIDTISVEGRILTIDVTRSIVNDQLVDSFVTLYGGLSETFLANVTITTSAEEPVQVFNKQIKTVNFEIQEIGLTKLNELRHNKLTKYVKNSINDKLQLTYSFINNNNTLDTIKGSVDLSNVNKQNFVLSVRFDPSQGNFTVFVNGVLHKNISLQRGKYLIHKVSKHNLIIGASHTYNSTTLTQENAQVSLPQNCVISNFALFDKVLSDSEIKFLQLTDIQPFTVTLPSGQRNYIDEVVKVFTYSEPHHYSSEFRLNIKGVSKEFQHNVDAAVRRKLREVVSADTRVNNIDIKFT